MKKIILILISCIMLIGIFALTVSANDERSICSYLEFNNTKKAYPIADNEEDLIGFHDYYNSDILSFHKEDGDGYYTINILLERDKFVLECVDFYGSYPMWQISVENPMQYSDIAIGYKDNIYCLYGFKDGVPSIIVELKDIEQMSDFSCYCSTTLSDGYYVEYSNNEIPEDEGYSNLVSGVIDITIVSLGGFVSGMGSTFNGAFTSLFIVNGVLNSLSIFMLCLMGVGLGYGVIRLITGLFRRKGD